MNRTLMFLRKLFCYWFCLPYLSAVGATAQTIGTSDPDLSQTAVVADTSPGHTVPRSVLVWNSQIISNESESENLLQFCKLRKINTIRLCTGSTDYFQNPETTEKLQQFILNAHTQNLKVEALDGWPEAIFPENKEQFLSSVEQVLNYNKSAPENARFTGFQSCVEFFILPGYYTDPFNKESYERLFLDLHEQARSLIDAAEMDDFWFGATLGAIYETSGTDNYFERDEHRATLFGHVVEIVDSISLTTYQDTAKTIIDSINEEIKLAERMGKSVWAVCETEDLFISFEGTRSMTFYEEGAVYMEKEMVIVHDHFRDSPCFTGFVIDYYDSYKRMPETTVEKYAFPVCPAQRLPSNTVVDGQFQEWSDINEQQIGKIEQLYYGKWVDSSDLSGRLWLGWNQKALHFKLIVDDDTLTQLLPDRYMWQGDHVEIWLEAPRLKRIYQFGFTPGDFDDMKPHTWVWHPKELDPEERVQIRKALTVAAVKRLENSYSMEGSINAEVLGYHSLEPGMEIRMGFGISDTDQTWLPQKSLLCLSPIFNNNKPETYSLIRLEQ